MNLLIYVISISIVIGILYHLHENIKNLWGVREGFTKGGIKPPTPDGGKGKWVYGDLGKDNLRCSNYGYDGTKECNARGYNCIPQPDYRMWVRNMTTRSSLQDCANHFGEEGIFTYRQSNGSCSFVRKSAGNFKVHQSGYYNKPTSCKLEGPSHGTGYKLYENKWEKDKPVPKCVRSTTTTGYDYSGVNENLQISSFSVNGLKCASGYMGNPNAIKCSGDKQPYLVSGCTKIIPSKRLSNHRQSTTNVYNTITGNCMPATTLILIGKNPRKPQKNTILKEAKQWDGKWDNFVMSFVIKPLGEGNSSYQNIMHNTFDGMNSNNSDYSRWPGIWVSPSTTKKIKLHIKWSGNQGTDPSYELPLNQKSRVTLIIDGSKYTCIIRDENDDIKHEHKETLGSGHSPPSKSRGDGSTIPLIDYGGSMEKMPNNPQQTKLGECEGDCDYDHDCRGDMKCFQRTGGQGEAIPGCRDAGQGKTDWDYCYYKDNSALPFFYMSDPWYAAFNCEISELILDSNVSHPTCKLLEKQTRPTGLNAFYFACERKTFMEHHLAAIAMGGHLASIHTTEENEAIRKILPPCQKVWIGAVRKRPGSGNSAEKWTWTDGSNWDYANWRSGEPNDCCKGQTENRGEVHAEIQKKDGKWNDIMHKYNNDVKKFAAVYKLNATYENSWPAGIVRLNTDGMNSWSASKKLCEGEANSGNIVGAHGTIASRREVLDFIKGKPESGDSWTPVSDEANVWLQVGMRNDRSGITPSFAMTHQEIPDVAYTKSGEAGKPSWGTSNTKRAYRKSLFCKKPPDGMTWDNNLEKFVKAKIPDQISSTGSVLPSAITNQRRLPSAITTQKHSTGEKTLAVGNDHKFKPGQRIVIGVPPNTEKRTIIKA